MRGAVGWAEWSPFAEYTRPEIDAWWQATVEAAETGFPAPVRDRVPVNVTVPAVAPEIAHRIVAASGCRTAKVKVAEPGQDFGDDLARVEAVRDALGPDGRIRVDANGAWDVDTALTHLARLSRFGLEYAEQPCARRRASWRRCDAGWPARGIDVLIAADESIRRSGDPERVVAEQAADIAVLKVQPLGGVRRCLELAERLGLPVVVSSALESSVGLAAGRRPRRCPARTALCLRPEHRDHVHHATSPPTRWWPSTARSPCVRSTVDENGDWRAGAAATAAWQARLAPVRAAEEDR